MKKLRQREDVEDNSMNWPMAVMFVITMTVVLFAAWRDGQLQF